ncbi:MULTISPECIES: DUF945 family protein [unclassified Thioalkalivibrio]|uniref:DUF945 family protein n=1 Tax=unclassified Thioalkalivibrio TaxID=2621013 RepID=UPI000373A2ED|nr:MULTISPECIES: DUF945 family protein [unclassified Thioalkalivibrio]
MRKWIVLLLVLLIVVAAWPVFVGGQVERNVTESQQARIGEVDLRHEMVEYRRSYRTATARSELTLDDGETELVIPLEHRVRHGVLGARGESNVDLGALEAPEGSLAAHLLHELDLVVQTHAGMGGRLTTRVQFEPLTLDLMEVPDVADRVDGEGPLWLELDAGQGRFAWSAEQLLLSLDLPALRLHDDEADLRVEQGRFATVFEPDEDGIYGRLPDYEGGLAAAQLRFRDEQGEMELTRPRVNAFQKTNNDRLDSRLRLEIDEVRLREADADVLELETVDLQFAMLRWDRPALLQMIQDLEVLQERDLERGQRLALGGSVITDAIERMIEHRPAVELKASFNKSPAHQVALETELGLRGDARGFRTRPLETLVLDSELRLGLEWVREFDAAYPDAELDERLHALAAQGWLQRDADAELWRGHLNMEDGRVYVNERDRTAALLGMLFALSGGMF